jgi:hypothetical protein
MLFIIDKYAGATHLIKEMKLIGGNKNNQTFTSVDSFRAQVAIDQDVN